MLGNPIYSSYRYFFPQGWIYSEVREKFDPVLKWYKLPFKSIEDYLNSTIVNASLPGINDNLTSGQVINRGSTFMTHGQTRKFQSALQHKELVNKNLSIEMSLKNSYLNWMILYAQCLHHLNHKKGDTFFKNIYLQIFDDYDNIIMEVAYKEILLSGLSEQKMSKQDIGLLNKTFTLDLSFNDFDFIFHIDDKSRVGRDDELHKYNY